MRIGIFGGSFNPPHNRHVDIAKYLLNEYVDKIIFVPTGVNYEYKNNLISNKHRYNMVKLITDKFKNLDVSIYEMQERLVYTYETLDYFQSIYSNDEIYFICGSDNLSYIDKWKKSYYLLSNYKFLVIDRNTDRINEFISQFIEYKDNIICVPMELNDLSSTYIRKNVDKKEEILGYLDADVFNYIYENKLYE